MYYSTKLFKTNYIPINPSVGSALVGLFNLVSSMGSFILLEHFGRVTLIKVSGFIMGATLIMLSLGDFCLQNDEKSYLVMFIFIFVIMFEYSIGPIAWLYMSEIMVDKGVAIGTTINWFMVIIVTLITPIVLDNTNYHLISYMFIFYGVFCVLISVFGITVMKETKGLTE